MSDTAQIVCPQCDAINRLPLSKLHQHPNCGRCKQPLFTGQPLELTGANFAKHVQNTAVPVVVDFWAPWCGPCRMMAPAFAQAARQLEPAVRLVKVNTEEEQALAGTYNIRSIPTLAIFKQGRELTRQAGAMPAESLVKWIRQYV